MRLLHGELPRLGIRSASAEPEFLIVKKFSGSGNTGRWFIVDTMRGMSDSTNGAVYLAADSTDAEATTTAFVPTLDGFRVDSTGDESNIAGASYLYMAIRRPHKAPTTGTDVFAVQASRATSDGTSDSPTFTSNFPVDLLMQLCRAGNAANASMQDRVREAAIIFKLTIPVWSNLQAGSLTATSAPC